MKRWLLIPLLLVAPLGADTLETFIELTQRLEYVHYEPEGYDRDGEKKWPVVLFLHGAGERGSDVAKLYKHGPLKAVKAGEEWPFFVIAPQCPEGMNWSAVEPVVWELVQALLDTESLDRDRVYVTGLSMGGFGAFAMAARHPEEIAAIAPICGGGDPHSAEKIAHLPTWVVHGALDEAVSITESVQMVLAMRKAGGEPRFTVYPYGGHNVWTRTYEDPAFWDWLLAQRRGAR